MRRRSLRLGGNAITDHTGNASSDVSGGPVSIRSNQSAHPNISESTWKIKDQSETTVRVGMRAQLLDGNSIADNAGKVSGDQRETTVTVVKRAQRLDGNSITDNAGTFSPNLYPNHWREKINKRFFKKFEGFEGEFAGKVINGDGRGAR